MSRFITWFTNLYPIWLIIAAAIGLIHPPALVWFNPWVVTALGFVMLNMGLTLSVEDFKRLSKMPGSVAVGFGLHYTIMPLSGWLIGRWLHLDPQLAVGLILVASCPCGTASNLMTYLARGNLALSVCLTMISTMLAFVMTPLWCQQLAGHYVPVNAIDMSISTLKMVVGPVLAGVVINACAPGFVRRIAPFTQVFAVIAFLFVTGGIVARDASAVIASAGVLFAAATLLHVMGFGLGYGAARLFGYPLNIARTLSIEVGMQNGGLAAALARTNIPTMPLAAVPAVFSSLLQNLVGSVIATWWRTHPVEDTRS
jgi:BASS family bile acid:Na+ symporter